VKLTNKRGHPAPVVKAVEETLASYSSGKSWISLTTLIGTGARLRAFQEHDKLGLLELEQDVDDVLAAATGTVIHDWLENHSRGDGDVAEVRVYKEINGKLVGGQFDHLEASTETLRDWKNTSVWSFALAKDGVKPDWSWQLNALKMFIDEYKAEGHCPEWPNPTNLEIFAILTDWSRSKAKTDPQYPKGKGHRVTVPVLPKGKVQAYLERRVAYHLKHDGKDPLSVPECSPEERWQKPSVFAVMSPGRKSSHRNLPSREEAESFIMEKGLESKKAYVEERKGANVRCADWCPARHLCPVGQQESSNGKA